MDTLRFYRTMFEYDLWANRQALESLKTVSDSEESPRRFFAHVIGASRIWFARFENPDPKSVEVWPTLTLDDCRKAIEEEHARWTVMLARFRPERFDEDLKYRNTKGIEFKTPIRDVLMHVLMHSAYHRGQVAAAVRQSGGKPAATDYVVYLRQ